MSYVLEIFVCVALTVDSNRYRDLLTDFLVRIRQNGFKWDVCGLNKMTPLVTPHVKQWCSKPSFPVVSFLVLETITVRPRSWYLTCLAFSLRFFWKVRSRTTLRPLRNSRQIQQHLLQSFVKRDHTRQQSNDGQLLDILFHVSLLLHMYVEKNVKH